MFSYGLYVCSSLVVCDSLCSSLCMYVCLYVCMYVCLPFVISLWFALVSHVCISVVRIVLYALVMCCMLLVGCDVLSLFKYVVMYICCISGCLELGVSLVRHGVRSLFMYVFRQFGISSLRYVVRSLCLLCREFVISLCADACRYLCISLCIVVRPSFL